MDYMKQAAVDFASDLLEEVVRRQGGNPAVERIGVSLTDDAVVLAVEMDGEIFSVKIPIAVVRYAEDAAKARMIDKTLRRIEDDEAQAEG